MEGLILVVNGYLFNNGDELKLLIYRVCYLNRNSWCKIFFDIFICLYVILYIKYSNIVFIFVIRKLMFFLNSNIICGFYILICVFEGKLW